MRNELIRKITMKYLYPLYFFLFCSALNAAEGDNSKNDTPPQSLTFKWFSLAGRDITTKEDILCRIARPSIIGTTSTSRSLPEDNTRLIEHILKYDANNEMGAICNVRNEEIATLQIKRAKIEKLLTKEYYDGKTVSSHFKSMSRRDNNLTIDEYEFKTEYCIYLYYCKKNQTIPLSISINKIKKTNYNGPLFPATLNQPSSFPKKFIAPLILGTITILFIISECYEFSHITKKFFGK